MDLSHFLPVILRVICYVLINNSMLRIYRNFCIEMSRIEMSVYRNVVYRNVGIPFFPINIISFI